MNKEIDPASIRYRIAGREYRIGTRIWTIKGLGAVTGFRPGEQNDIGVTLDGQKRVRWLTWRDADLVDDEPARSDDAEDSYRRRFG